MKNKKYSHVFFDLDNTLWDFKNNSRSAMFQSFNFFRINEGTDFDLFFEVYSRHNHELWESYRNKEIGKSELIKQRFQKTLSELNIQGIEPEKMNEHYLGEMPKQKILNPGALEILHYLKSKRYELSIITNGFREVQLKKLQSSGLDSFFDRIVISEVVKTPKPGSEIFEYAVKSTNAKKAKSIMVGDDWKVDVLGALQFGIDAVHFDPCHSVGFQEMGNPANGSTSVFKIASLEDLRRIL